MKVKNGVKETITVETEKMNIAVDLGARLQQAFGAAERERLLAVERGPRPHGAWMRQPAP